MEEIHRRILKKNRPYLVKELMLNTLWQHLAAREIFTDEMIDHIKATGALPSQTQRLLTDLTRRGPNAYGEFLECLVDSEQGHIAEKLITAEEELRKKEPKDLLAKFHARQISVTLNETKLSNCTTYSPGNHCASDHSLSTHSNGSLLHAFTSTPRQRVSQETTAVVTKPSSAATADAMRASTRRVVSLADAGNISSEPGRSTLSFTGPRILPQHREETTPDRQPPTRQMVKKNLFTTTTTDNGDAVDILEVNHYPDHFGIPETTGRLEYFLRPSATRRTTGMEIYKMDSNPRGYCLIINNRYFPNTHLKQRMGTDVDRDNLYNLFSLLGYMVDISENMTGMEMLLKLQKFALFPGHSTVDSCVVVLLTHGLDGKVYGIDGLLINLSEVFRLFDGSVCPALRGKPKFFLVQACRGEMYDGGFDCTDDSTDMAGNTQAVYEMQQQQETDINTLNQKLPSLADFLIAYATIPGFVSWRNSDRGSWFVQALCEVFGSNQCHTEDAVSMLVEVNNRVATIYESATKHKQMPSPVILLRKKLFFKPIVEELASY